MSLPDQMSHTSRTDPRPESLPRSLLVMLALLVLLGVAGFVAQVIDARDRTGTDRIVLEQLRQQERETAENVDEHRVRNEQLHACIVELALALADPNRDRSEPIKNPCPEPVLEEGVTDD